MEISDFVEEPVFNADPRKKEWISPQINSYLGIIQTENNTTTFGGDGASFGS